MPSRISKMHIFFCFLTVNFELIKILDNFDESVKKTDIKVIDAIQLIRLNDALTEIYVHTYVEFSYYEL